MDLISQAAMTQQRPLEACQTDDEQHYPAITARLYLLVKQHLLEVDADTKRLVDWTLHHAKPPATPEQLAGEITWIILCAGRTAQSARTIERRARAAAIERAWAEREADFAALQRVLAAKDPHQLIDWCGGLPGVGAVTRFQLAKNFGMPVIKPDLWMCRFAGIRDGDRMPAMTRFDRCPSMATAISDETGDPVPLVDSMLWQAGNKGILRVEFDPHTVIYRPGGLRRGSIY